MKTPSVDTKSNTHRVKTHWSVYAHYVSLPIAILFFILAMGGQVQIIQTSYGMLAGLMALTFGGLHKITEPIVVPEDNIENQIRFTEKAIRYKKGDISFVSKGLLFCTIWCLVAFLYPLI